MANVIFEAPAIGATAEPLGISGPGLVEVRAEGLELQGLVHSKNAASAFGCFGFLIGFFGAIAILVATGIKPDTALGKAVIGIGLALTVGAVLLGRKIFPPKSMQFVVPWAKVKKLGADGRYVTFRSAAKPKGQVWFVVGDVVGQPTGEQLATLNLARDQVITAIRAAAAAAGVML